MLDKYSIFSIQGGLGKNIAATAVAKCIKNNYPDRKLIVVCPYPDIFINLSYVDRVYLLGNTSYFYQTYIENQDSLIFANEPYYTTTHIHKKLPLIQSWCSMYNLTYNGEQPDIIFNVIQQDISKSIWKPDSRPIMVLHTNGGLIAPNSPPYLWARDMPFNVAQEIVNRYKKDYLIYQCTKINSRKLDGATPIEWNNDMKLSTMEFLSILIHSDKRVLIDSCLQHAAMALNLPSVVLWNGTSTKVFGYDLHTNIETAKPQNFKLPNSYLFDFDFTSPSDQYPFKDSDELYNLDKIFESIDNISYK
jgi:hypothetical protein